MKRSPSELFGLTETELHGRLSIIRQLVAKPVSSLIDTETQIFQDPHPAIVENSSILIGNKYHASDVNHLVKSRVTAVLNCASGGIPQLPINLLKENNIDYHFTNVRRDDLSYPILHSHQDGVCSQHLEIAKELYRQTLAKSGKVLFFCVAGQNRSATLALAVLLLYGHSLDDLLVSCSKERPFILENEGFQKQLVELEKLLTTTKKIHGIYNYGSVLRKQKIVRTQSQMRQELDQVEIELLIPGLCTMDVKIPVKSSIDQIKKCLINHVNQQLLSSENKTVNKSWTVLAMFGHDTMYDLPLETDAVELRVQHQRLREMFGLEVVNGAVEWNANCRFALVIISINFQREGRTYQEPWTFEHTERPGAKATLLENNLVSTHLRAWDFVTGQAFASKNPIVFSFAENVRDKRQFMKISTSANTAQQFHAPGEGGILGMGNNAIVHHVELEPTSPISSIDCVGTHPKEWDAAVKRPFSLSKMLAFLKSSSEAGLAKRMRFANLLNNDGRVVHFYGLGVALSANADKPHEYKFEATLLARYEKEFSTYTMKRFMEDYTSRIATTIDPPDIQKWRDNFTLISVKVLLVSLLNAFRDLTLMGVQAFDFNHLSNVLVSRDYQTVKLLDIDGNSKGSIQFPSEYIHGQEVSSSDMTSCRPIQQSVHKPALDIDLNVVLPTVVNQLLLGKGRGKSFVENKKREIWKAPEEKAKELVKEVIRENFFKEFVNNHQQQNCEHDNVKREKHIAKVAEWYYAMLKKQAPWGNWTNDIYDSMRVIDHLPVA